MDGGDFQEWIGRTVTRRDVVTSRIVEQFRATLAPYLFDAACPPGLHWCLAVAQNPQEDLGPDGAEKKGLFIPPIDLPRRMWAGGSVESHGSFAVGDEVERISRIADITWRTGKTGPLCIVSVVHELSARGILVVRERHDLLFRNGGIATTSQPQDVTGTQIWRVEATPLLLFRFSALTFNGHRIHYDLAYAREVDGYGGLLVHGPLQAALTLNLLAASTGRVPRRFDYRCVAPLIHGAAFTVSCEGGRGRVQDARGIVTLEATTA
jgi:3-methylfumaryl-CoA hydratase